MDETIIHSTGSYPQDSTDRTDSAWTVKNLIEAGVHLGHKRESWNPKMAPYIFTERKGICVIDPEKTLKHLIEACEAVKKVVITEKRVLFIGTKKQIADVVKEEALRCGAFYCTRRWLGGTLTNFVTIRRSVEKLKLLESRKDRILTKKERASLEKQLEKMHRNLEGIMDMDEFPGIIYVTDVKHEKTAVNEALKLGIPIVGIVDTNVDPTPITYPIPANDDAIKSVRLITQAIADAILEARAQEGVHPQEVKSGG